MTTDRRTNEELIAECVEEFGCHPLLRELFARIPKESSK